MQTYETLRDDVATRVGFLPDKPEETPDSTLRALWLTAAGKPISAEASLSVELPQLSDGQAASLAQLIDRRASGVPLAHLTQRQRFMEMEMLAGAQALVPRKETELLARAAIQLTRDLGMPQVKVLDVCTGSGNVALAIAHHLPTAYVFAADLSEEAVELARQNARHLKLNDRTEFRAGDLLQPFDSPEFLGQIDVLTCNPPYINSAKVERMPTEISAHEPRLAFDGGSLGIGILMRLLNEAPRFVRSGGWLAFEVGLGQGPALVKRMKAGVMYKDIATVQDDAGAIRVVMARC
jgi:release factor glutamine methyltransferase